MMPKYFARHEAPAGKLREPLKGRCCATLSKLLLCSNNCMVHILAKDAGGIIGKAGLEGNRLS